VDDGGGAEAGEAGGLVEAAEVGLGDQEHALEAAIDVFSKVLHRFGIAQPSIAQFAEAMRMEGYEFLRESATLPIDPWVAEVLAEVTQEWVDVPAGDWGERTIVELAVRTRTGANVLAVRRDAERISNPPPGFAIRPGDALLVMATGTGKTYTAFQIVAGLIHDTIEDTAITLRIEGTDYPVDVTFIEDDALREQVETTFREKYGWSDAMIGVIRGSRPLIMQVASRT